MNEIERVARASLIDELALAIDQFLTHQIERDTLACDLTPSELTELATGVAAIAAMRGEPDSATDAENQRLRAEVKALREALSTLSSYVGAGLGDEKTTPQQFIARINWGINHIEGSAFERAAAIVEDCSKRPSTTWGEVKRALLNVSQALTRKAPQ